MARPTTGVSCTQSGGELNGTGTLTVTGASSFSGGRQSGSGTTIAQGGAAFTLTDFGLDGGRTLQLGGTSTASGTNVQINLNSSNPSTGVSDPGSGTLTIASGATFTDQTTTSGLTIFAAQPRRHRYRGHGGGEQSGHVHQERQCDDLDDQHAVQQQRHRKRHGRHAQPQRWRHGCRGVVRGRRHD